MYDFESIEERWRKKWDKNNTYAVESNDKKEYVLTMFPYPSGEGLHLGHTRVYTAGDVYARMRRMQGCSVLFPTGWDAFGLPTEQYAIKTGVSPQSATEKNVVNFKKQLQGLGCSFDWSREVNTSDPSYYKWTQWLFLQFMKKGAVERIKEKVNWCPSCLTTLANEDLEGIECERCGTDVEQKEMLVWVFKITEYANKLLEGLDTLEWPEYVKTEQREWIGKSDGYIVSFPISDSEEEIEVFTTRADTVMGVTYLVLAPEHPLVEKLIKNAENKDEINQYLEDAKKMTNMLRVSEKEKTGVCIKGKKAKHPATGLPLNIFVANYVLYDYGTGAIMAVPAHDERDFEFATKYNMPIIKVIESDTKNNELCYTGGGTMVNSMEFNGLNNEEAKDIIGEKLGKEKITVYRLRDWVFSRQRYWGEPIPVMYCGDEMITLSEKDLPLKLPELKEYHPSKDGKSPLDRAEDWKKVKCPDGSEGVRELDTMPSWAGSSWYYLRFIDPENTREFVSKSKEKDWMPVTRYVGGKEHISRHLIYARYWHKLMYELGYVSTDEPFSKLELTGIILGPDGKKMSKRYGNIISPTEVVKKYGADALRLYIMFLGPFSKIATLKIENIVGSKKFLERLWAVQERVKDTRLLQDIETLMHITIKKVTKDIENFHFNTAVSQMMILLNRLEKEKKVPAKAYDTLLLLLAPFCPFVVEEIWEARGHRKSIHKCQWPSFSEKKTIAEEVKLPVQVNGKLRGIILVSENAKDEEVLKDARKKIKGYLKNSDVKREIYIRNRAVNFVISEKEAQ